MRLDAPLKSAQRRASWTAWTSLRLAHPSWTAWTSLRLAHPAHRRTKTEEADKSRATKTGQVNSLSTVFVFKTSPLGRLNRNGCSRAHGGVIAPSFQWTKITALPQAHLEGGEVTASCLPPRRPSKRFAGRLGVAAFFPLVFSLILILFGTSRSYAADPCLDNLPAPTPLLHRVVQLVNCSNQRVLGAANAAHVPGSPPVAVLPREKTWVMEPFPVPAGAPANANVLTIDIPVPWENTSPEGSTGPNFWVRTGCRYDVQIGIAQCETGGCSGFYDCSKALLGPPAGATLAEWTFYQATTVGGKTYYLDHPDISAVNGVNLNLDIQPVGGSPSNPIAPDDPQWLAANYPPHGARSRSQNARRRARPVPLGVSAETFGPDRGDDAADASRPGALCLCHRGR
jgi:hypothetical protein